MITGGFERLRQVFKNARAVVRNCGRFPVHQFRGARNFAAVNFADTLVTEANAEHRTRRAEFTNDIATNSPAGRPARSGRDADAFRNKLSTVSRARLVVAFHQNASAQLPENLRE